MTRQSYNVNTSDKKIEVFGSFGGGMVTQSHPEKLRDDQSVLLENADVVHGGVVQSRGAYVQTTSNSSVFFTTFAEFKTQVVFVDLKIGTFLDLNSGFSTDNSGNTQGKFRYNQVGGHQDIVAINGFLYTVVGNVYTKLGIAGLLQFQITRPIEAIQSGTNMYFATGSGLVVYDGAIASLVTAYAPTGLEALYIGTNGLAANPDNYLSDMVGAANVILGVTVDQRYGVINKNVLFTAFIEKIAIDVVEYKFETKTIGDVDYTMKQDWSTTKTFTTAFTTKNEYMVRVSLRKQGTTPILSQYILPRYKVNTTPDEKPEPTINFDDIKLCNRIFMHYDRLFLYGDTGNPDSLYVSHLDKFSYFPRTNIIKVTDPLRGSLQNVTQYKNFLVCFTDGSIQMITGKNPSDFDKQPIHTTLGTKSPYSVQVMRNYIIFVASDNGIYVLKSFNYASGDKLNVERIDGDIRDVVEDIVSKSKRTLSAVYNSQYYLYIEHENIRYVYRYYYDMSIWVRDTVSLAFATMENIDNILTTTGLTSGTIYELKPEAFLDARTTPYTMRITSKNYTFGVPHHKKKMKQYQLLAKFTPLTDVTVDIYADNTKIISEVLKYDSSQDTDAQKLKVMASGRFRYVKTDITIPVNEIVQLIGFGFVFKENTPK